MVAIVATTFTTKTIIKQLINSENANSVESPGERVANGERRPRGRATTARVSPGVIDKLRGRGFAFERAKQAVVGGSSDTHIASPGHGNGTPRGDRPGRGFQKSRFASEENEQVRKWR